MKALLIRIHITALHTVNFRIVLISYLNAIKNNEI